MPQQTWLIVGASRGIGLEFVTQLLDRGDIVIATARASPPSTSQSHDTLISSPNATSTSHPDTRLSASKLLPLLEGKNGRNLTVLECDVSDEESIKRFAGEVRNLGEEGGVLANGERPGVIDVVVINAGILEYPGRICEITFSSFAHHLNTNTIGPLLTAQHLLALSCPLAKTSTPAIHIRTLVFTSSDSGSTTNFRSFEDGFGAYSVSKAALNQGLRHLAAELDQKASAPQLSENDSQEEQVKAPVVLAIHPGEVSTDMAANVSLDWEVEGIISPEESIRCMLKTISEKGWGGEDEGGKVSSEREGQKGEDGEASFWTWEGERYPW